jgi:hypothetical protein
MSSRETSSLTAGFSILVRMAIRRGARPDLVVAAIAAVWIASSPAAAQTAAPLTINQPIGWFVVDVHGVLGRYSQPNQVAAALGVAKADLPSLGIGAGAGVHVYPLRWGGVTFGAGVSAIWTRGLRTPTDTTGQATGPTVETKLAAITPQLSLNFGTRKGWSYISVGVGPAKYSMRLAAEAPPPSIPRVQALNYGAGARWFAKRHLAFSFDVRWYSLPEQAETAETPAVPRTTRMVFSAGISLK